METQLSQADIQAQVAKAWSPALEAALVPMVPLRTLGLYNTRYQGEMPMGAGDRVRVSQVKDDGGQGDLRTIGTDANSYTLNSFQTGYVDLIMDLVAQYGIGWEKYLGMQTILNPNAEAIELVAKRIARTINEKLYSMVAPATAYSSVSALDYAELKKGRIQSMKDYWNDNDPKYLLASPDYYGDLLGEEKFINLDYGAGENTVSQGLIAKEVAGWRVIADPSRTGRTALGINLNWLYYAEAPMDITYVDKTAVGEKSRGVLAEIPFACALSNNGAKLHYTWNA